MTSNNADLKEFIIEHGEGRHLCPVCNGGRSRELTFKVYRAEEVDSPLLFGTCYRASCDLHGKSIPSIGKPGGLPKATPKPHREFTEDVDPLPIDMYPYISGDLRRQFGWQPGPERLVQRVKVPRTTPTGVIVHAPGLHAGVVVKETSYLRHRSGYHGSKVKNFIHPDHEGKGAWFGVRNFTRPNVHILLFEDMLSAARVYCAQPESVCVASLGTRVTPALAQLIRQRSEDSTTTVVYDTDAIKQGIRAGQALDARVFFTDGPDVKDLSDADFLSFITALGLSSE